MQRKIDTNGRYCLYLRKSRADRDNMLSSDEDVLSRHEHILMDLARRMNISITKIFREVVSGDTIASRPKVQELLAEVEDGLWDGVLVVEVERLARGDTIDQGIISRSFTLSQTLIITPAKIYDPEDEFDSEYFEFGLFMSRREYKTINRRLNRGRTQSASEGKFIGYKPPYGYERVKLKGEKGFILSPLPDQANIVRMIYDFYVNGDSGKEMGVSLIVRRLNDLHVPAANGGDWTNASIQTILANPEYTGMIRHKARPTQKKVQNGIVSYVRPRSQDYQLFKGRHDAIISEELFNAAQEKRKNNPPRPVPTRHVVKNPLSGLIICEKCGRRMVRRPYNSKNKTDTLLCYHTNCPQVGCPLYLVEQEIIKGLRSIVDANINTDIASAYESADSLESKKQLLQTMNNQLQNLQTQKKRIYDFLEQGIYTTDEFLTRSASNTDKIIELENNLKALHEEIDAELERQANRSLFIPKCEHLLSHYEEMSIEEKNACLKELIEKVIYNKDEKNKWGKGDVANFTLHLYPKIMKEN